jgi:hypothetical protein
MQNNLFEACSLSCIPFYIGIEQIALGGRGGGGGEYS